MGGLQFLSLLLGELVGIHCLINDLFSLVLDQELSEVSVVVALHLPEENITFSMLRLFKQKVIQQLQDLSTYGSQLILNFLPVDLDQVQVLVALYTKIKLMVNIK